MAKKVRETSAEDRLAAALVPANEQPYQVPENWVWTYLGELADINMGQSPEGSATTDEPTYMPLIGGAADMGELCPNVSRYTKIPTKISEKDDIILCIRATLGRPIFADGKYCLGRGVAGIRPLFGCKELYRFGFLHFEQYLYDHATGSTFAQVTGKVLQKMPFPLIPLPEQRRIVERIESLFAKLDEAKDEAQAVIDGYEDRKAAILHRAFTGELTEEWRKKSKIDISNWHTYTYADLGVSKLGKMLDTEKNEGKYVPYLRNVNVRWFSFDTEDVLQMRATEDDINKLSIVDDDLLICEGGEPGRCAVWERGRSNMIFQKALHRFRPYKFVFSRFLAYYIFHYSKNGTLQKYFTGTTIKHLTGQSLAKITFLLPTLPEQHEIVRRLDALLTDEAEIKSEAEATLENIAALKQSILARAFRGELGTNDTDDEPAVELLKRTLEGAQ